MNPAQRRRLLERDSSGKPTFRYIPAAKEHHIRDTFARVRAEQELRVIYVPQPLRLEYRP